ncbi:MAG: WD40 repeat domain-containing serine/threonine protein kinase, partial [Planctomycetota bacterium]
MSGEEHEQVREGFRRLYLADARGEGARSLPRYQQLFPGHWSLVAEEYERLQVESLPPAPSSEAETDTGPEARDTKFIGPYRLDGELGRGGMGVVYLATDTRLDRLVALKVLPPAFSSSGESKQRFDREASVTSRLDHPGVCTVYEAGEDGGTHYIAMRYVDGTALADILTERSFSTPEGPRTVVPGASRHDEIADVCHLVEKAARALHTAHEAGLIHRDIKPHNIMIPKSGDPVILDFGLARAEDDSDQTALTRTGSAVGTPAYMSPEQIRAERDALDRRTDVYSLGVTLYECLTLHLPFEAPTRDALYRKILLSDPDDPRRHNPDLPDDLRVVLETALEKDRNRRYQSALDLAEELRRVRMREPILARHAGPLVRLRRFAERRPALTASLAAVFLSLAGGLGVSLDLLSDVREERDAKSDALTEVERQWQRAEQQKDRAEQAARRADGLRLAALSMEPLETQPKLALRLSIEAWDRAPDPASRDAVFRALDQVREERTLRGHDSYVFTVRWSKDGTRLVSAEWGTQAIIWDAASGEALHRLDLHTDELTDVRFSHDGRRVVTTSHDGTARLWSTVTGACEQVLEGHEAVVCQARFSPDDTLVATVSDDGTARLWNTETGDQVHLLSGQGHAIHSVAFHPGGGELSTMGRDFTWRTWDPATGRQMRAVVLDDAPVRHPWGRLHTYYPIRQMDLTYSPDGSRVAIVGSTNRGHLRVLDAKTSREEYISESGVAMARWLPGGEGIAFIQHAAPVH